MAKKLSDFQVRNGPRTRAERVRELLKASTSNASERFTIGGQRKEGRRAPRPVTLPKISALRDLE